MRVQAQGRGHNGKKFRETCENRGRQRQGGLLTLKHEVNNGEMLVMTNPESRKSRMPHRLSGGSWGTMDSAWHRISYAGAALLGSGIRDTSPTVRSSAVSLNTWAVRTGPCFSV